LRDAAVITTAVAAAASPTEEGFTQRIHPRLKRECDKRRFAYLFMSSRLTPGSRCR
jgi:hypothetical protein